MLKDFVRLLLCDLFRLILGVLLVTALVHKGVSEDEIPRNSKNEPKPEQVHGLQRGEKAECDVLTDPALKLSTCPVELERSNSFELGQCCPQNAEVDVMTKVYPHPDKQNEIRPDDDRV